MIRAVADTNVLVSALLKDGPSRRIIRLAADKKIELYLSSEIMGEFGKVLARDFKYNERMVEKAQDAMLANMITIETKTTLNVVSKDPTDNKILECAVDAKAEYVLSYDRHLLELKHYKEISIMTPDSFLTLNPRLHKDNIH
jgi:putative PIN family toxin of toxin-antitoxin system